jgi:hypothetical protein
MVFSPDPEPADATSDAADRWSAATGCNVRVGEGGLRVMVLDQVIGRDGLSYKARVNFSGTPGNATPLVMEIRRDELADAQRLVLHEMGHALGGHAHTATGVMRLSSDPNAMIDKSSLDLVCANLACPDPDPE